LRFQLISGQLRGEMVRLESEAAGSEWRVRDHFALDAKTLLGEHLLNASR